MMPNNRRVTHPGKILYEYFMIPNRIYVPSLARETGESELYLIDLCLGEARICERSAKNLAKFFFTTEIFWKKLQENFDRREINMSQGPYRDNDDRIFVFGSNLRGIHGAGAALYAAQKCGAEFGIGSGRMGMSYAIPTCFSPGRPLHLSEVADHVRDFLKYAKDHPDLRFFVTAVGTGFAGFAAEQIAPLFRMAPDNCDLPPGWEEM